MFGIDSFRSIQREVINATMARRDTFVLMPTGGGKSLCYQLPAISSDGVTIVISPLLALIHDQVMGLLSYNIPCAFLGANQNETTEVYKGSFRFVSFRFVSFRFVSLLFFLFFSFLFFCFLFFSCLFSFLSFHFFSYILVVRPIGKSS